MHSIFGERERAYLVVSTADFSLYWRAGASLPSRFNGRFFSLYIYIYNGRWTPPYRNVLRDSKYAHKCEIS